MRKRRLFLLLFLLLLFGFVFADMLGLFNDKPYDAISHGSHTHFVPKDRDPDVPMSQFPTREPGPDERILPDGRIVPATTP